jgi:hypothetical protein
VIGVRLYVAGLHGIWLRGSATTTRPEFRRREQSRFLSISTRVPCSVQSELGTNMQEYCAYIIGPDGHFLSRIDLHCADEGEAKECAVRLVDGQNVELWQGDRRIAEFKRRH